MGERNAVIQQYGVIPTPPPLPPPLQSNSRKFYLPCQDLLDDDRRREFLNTCVPLCKASIIGDWKTAKHILQNNNSLVGYCITENFETALHIAASAESTDFMDELLKMMNKEDLLLQTKSGDTALCLAAAAGNVKMAHILVDGNQNLDYSVEYLLAKQLELKNENWYERLMPRNENLLTISGSERLMPLSVAALYGKVEMVEYLYHKSNDIGGPEWNTFSKQWVLLKCVNINLFDIALRIIDKHGQLGQSENILRALAMKPLAFNKSKPRSIFPVIHKSDAKESAAMQLLKKVWTNIAEGPKYVVDKILKGPRTLMNGRLEYNSPILFLATKMGNTEFVAALIREYPDLIWKKNDNNQSIFHIAVSHRQENIYSMLHQIGSMKDLITRLRDKEGNNMLHLVGRGENNSKNVAGVAFQLQRELLWYKEVQSMVPPYYIEERNKQALTPYELFTSNRRRLVSEGEKWMKETASQCMVVATLIATVVFAAAFTLPGGYHQDSGFPVFREKGTFIVFVVLDAASLISSSTSILLFLSIFTSRCAQEDFLESLPMKLLAGLAMLFFSIMTMMLAFGISFFLLFQERYIGVVICISILAAIPVIAFAKLYRPFLMDAFNSQRNAALLFKPKKQLFHYQNPMV